MPDYAARLRAVQGQMIAQGIDLLFLPRSANLHYLTGIPRESTEATIPECLGNQGPSVSLSL